MSYHSPPLQNIIMELTKLTRLLAHSQGTLNIDRISKTLDDIESKTFVRVSQLERRNNAIDDRVCIGTSKKREV